MDDEAADVQLLDQYLHKTTLISQRMTTILKKFDDRLKHLERSILPLHTSTQALTRLADNIDSTMRSIDKVAGGQEDLAVEETVILRGPRSGDLKGYIEALERLNANLAFGGGQPSPETAQLIETGAKKLVQLFTKLVAEASSGASINPTTYLPSPPNPFPTIPTPLLQPLIPLVSALRGLPLPSTHPSHPSSGQILTTLKEAQSGYAEMRGTWGKKCLETGHRQVMGLVETDSDSGLEVAQEIYQWVEGLLALVEAESETLGDTALLPSMTGLMQNTLATLAAPLLDMFLGLFATIQSIVKKSLLTNVWLAFGLYGRLSGLQTAWDDVMRQRTGRKENELADVVHTLRALCLRSFPEFLLEIRQAGMPPPPTAKPVEVGTGVAEISKMAVKYLLQIPLAQNTTVVMLRTLGDGNWKMGEGNVVNKLAEAEASDEELLQHYIHDVVTALTNSLSSMARIQRRPSLSSIFLLNNVSFIRSKLLLEPETPIDDFISMNTQSHLNTQYRTAKAGYFEANFTVLVTSLGDDKVKGKSNTKEKIATFYDTLEEVAERHRFARVLGDDAPGRDGLADDVVRLVIPSLQRFLQKHRDKELSKNPQKHIKSSPEEVEAQIRNFYR